MEDRVLRIDDDDDDERDGNGVKLRSNSSSTGGGGIQTDGLEDDDDAGHDNDSIMKNDNTTNVTLTNSSYITLHDGDNDDDDNERCDDDGNGGASQQPRPPPLPWTTTKSDDECCRSKTNTKHRQKHCPPPPSSSSPFCTVLPPGADAFVDWYVDGQFHDRQQGQLQQLQHRAKEQENQPRQQDDGKNDIVELEEQRSQEDDDPVRTFMGPLNNSLAKQFQLRKRKHFEETKGEYRNRNGTVYETVSYMKIDTPVWHNYTMEVQRCSCSTDDTGSTTRNQQNLKTKKKKDTPTVPRSKQQNFSRVSQPDMSNSRKQLRTRPAISCLRQICSLPRSRKKTGPDHPVNTFQHDNQLVIRIVLIILGVSISLLSKSVEASSEYLLDWKLNFVTGLSNPFLAFVGLNLLFTLFAFIPITYRPVAAGSGIAEAKAVLNGVIIPQSTDLLTAFCKAISVIFAFAASMPVGLEGPLIFIGMSMGENAQRFLPKAYSALKTDQLKRDFAVVGTSCGVTGAFLAPIGGVIFAMEEGASYWSTRLAWSAFAASCVVCVTMYMWGLVLDKDLELDINSMAIYSGLDGENQSGFHPLFRLWDYVGFAVLGLAGGVAGSVWIHLNKWIAVWRKTIPGRFQFTYKLLELLILSLVVSAVLWYLPQWYTFCSDVSITLADDKSIFRQVNCPPGQYNHLATLFLNPVGSVGLNLLYWEPVEVFHPTTCLIAGAVYFVLLLLLFGTSISMGIFIPLLFIGACFGRGLAVFVGLSPEYVASYAIVSSVAMLAGVVRVLISISAIVMTATSLTYFVTPLMICSIFSRVMGKACFGEEGIYDVILELKGIPFLEAEAPKAIQLRGLKAQDVMSRYPIVTLEPESSVEHLIEVLDKSSFPDFPVVDPRQGGIFIGIITREDLLTVLSHTDLFFPPMKSNEDHDLSITHTLRARRRPALRFEELVRQRYRRSSKPSLQSIKQRIVDEHCKNLFVDLSPYVQIGSNTLNQLVSIERTYELFRSLGLRNLVITDHIGRPVGIITRYDLKLLEEVGVDEVMLERKRNQVGKYELS